MPRLNTIGRLRQTVAIPDAQIWDIGEGIVAVHPSYLNAIRQAFVNQPWYSTWLDRDYRASEVGVSATGKCVVLHKGPSTPVVLKPSTALFSAESEQLSITSGLGVELGVPTAGLQPDTYLYYPTFIFSNQSWFGTEYVRGGSQISVTGKKAVFDGAPLGPTRSYSTFLGAMSEGFAADLPGPTRVRHDINTVHTDVFSGTKTDWPLVVGPASLTRGEFYDSGLKYIVTTCTEAAGSVTSLIARLSDRNDIVRATAQRDRLLAQGSDCMVAVKFGAWTPYRMYGPTREQHSDLYASTEVTADYNLPAARVLIDSGKWHYSAAITSLPFTSEQISSPWPNVVYPLSITLSPVSLTTIAGVGSEMPLTAVADVVAGMARMGKAVTIVADDTLFTPADLVVITRMREAISRGAPAAPDYSFSVEGDFGLVAAAAISAVLKPVTANQEITLKTLLEPGFMDKVMF